MDELMPYYDIINQQQQQNNAWSAEQAQKAMDYQERMSNTAHQREVADLKAAGLNPVLSAGGSGASTTSGVAAQAGNENVTALYGLMSKALDASLAQAKASQTSAQAVAGATGSYNPAPADEPDPDLWSENSFVDGLQDFLYRRFGVKQATSDKIIDSIQDFVQNGGLKTTKEKYDRFLDKIAALIVNGQNAVEKFFLEDIPREASNSAKAHIDGIKNLVNKIVDRIDNTSFNAVNSNGHTGAGGSGGGNRRMVTK